jgi:hypothetical protein
MSPQVKTLHTHLVNHGSISNIEAQAMFKMRALPRRISDLKELGFKIRREIRRDSTGQRYARYYLVG